MCKNFLLKADQSLRQPKHSTLCAGSSSWWCQGWGVGGLFPIAPETKPVWQAPHCVLNRWPGLDQRDQAPGNKGHLLLLMICLPRHYPLASPCLQCPLLLYWRSKVIQGFPDGPAGKEPTCQCRKLRRRGFDTWVGKIPWRRAWQPIPMFLSGESHGERSLAGYSP